LAIHPDFDSAPQGLSSPKRPDFYVHTKACHDIAPH
jgi:hypothetical protein